MNRLRTFAAMTCLALGAVYTVALACGILTVAVWWLVNNVHFDPMR
jgi:hypothetical protein